MKIPNWKMMSAALLSAAVITTSARAVDIPVVPLSVMKDGVPKPLKKKPTMNLLAGSKTNSAVRMNSIPEGSGTTLSTDRRARLVMTPGVTEIVAIAKGHPNRVVTPFENPKITDTQEAGVEIRDNVIYVGTHTDAPITLYITEDGDESLALALTLIPKKIPPREITLVLDESVGVPTYSKKAEKWEKGQPYLRTIEGLFKGLALGEVPPGYNMQKSITGSLPYCRQPGLVYSFEDGQQIAGHNLTVYVGTVINTTQTNIEVMEEQCGDWDVAAVAAYPHNLLKPNQTTEMYVAKKRQYLEEIKVKRPSLIGGSQ